MRSDRCITLNWITDTRTCTISARERCWKFCRVRALLLDERFWICSRIQSSSKTVIMDTEQSWMLRTWSCRYHRRGFHPKTVVTSVARNISSRTFSIVSRHRLDRTSSKCARILPKIRSKKKSCSILPPRKDARIAINTANARDGR